MATFVNDTFTDTNAVLLENHTGETGATWAKVTGRSGVFTINTNRIYCTTTDAVYYASGSPASADYTVSGSVYVASTGTNSSIEVLGRAVTSALTYYSIYIERVSAGGGTIRLYLRKFVNASQTNLAGGYVITPAAASTHTLTLKMVGDQISGLYDGTVVLGPVTDTAITAAGNAGVRGLTAVSTTTGFHFLDISAADPIAATPAFAGAGALSAIARPQAVVAKTLPGTGVLTATAVATKFTLSRTLTGTGALTAARYPKMAVARSLPGTGTLTVTRYQKFAVAKSLPGQGRLTATTKIIVAKTLTGVGTLTATALQGVAPTPTGSGVLSATAVPLSVERIAAHTGSGALTVTRSQKFFVTRNVTGTGALTAQARLYRIAAAVALSATGTLSAARVPRFTRTIGLTGAGALAAAARMYQIRVSVGRTGTGTLTVVTVMQYQRTLPLAGTGLVTLTHQPVSQLVETFTAEDDLKWDFRGGVVTAGQLKFSV